MTSTPKAAGSGASWKSRRKFRRRHGDVDDWLMTYADLITLLLCFFAIFLSVSIPKEKEFARAQQELIEQFGAKKAPSSQVVGTVAPMQIPNIIPKLDDPALNYDSLPSIVGQFVEARPEGATTEQDRKGDRILRIEMDSAAFFPIGTAALSDEGKGILRELMTRLTSPQYQAYTITVEGHTDDNPINTPQFPSNWELSTARAAAVVREFITLGIPPSRLRASGYADTFPKMPNRDAAGKPIPAQQAQNRRVVIRLEKIAQGQ